MDYEKNQKYFKPISYGGQIALIIIGALLLLGLMSTNFLLAFLFGGGMLALGIFLIVLKKKNIVTDRQYDEQVGSMLKDMQGRALNKLGIDEDEVKEIAPISFDGYVYKGADYAKKGEDGLYRTNKYESVILFFSEHEVHCYTYNFTTTQKKQTESTDVYFYKDIVSVSTASETVEVLGFKIDYEYFKLTTAGGTALSVSLRDVDNAQRSINAMRALLKTKKQG
ncbi:MAG: hypothetical protein IK990_16450 [Ruminiclostridium sp.]|nr:hypothetical protein [Ruminiclostridium sp.]